MVGEQGSSLHFITAMSRRCRGDREGSLREMAHPRGCLLPVVAALALLTMPARASDRVDLRFEIFGFAGLHLLTSRTSAEVTPRSYAIAANLNTRGIVSAFVDLQSHSEVYGTLASQNPRPDDYRAEVRRNGTERDYEVKYLANGDVINTKAPPRRRSIDIDPAQLRGTVDQLTAYFLVERQLARTGSCSAIVPVYDGSELYRMRFIDIRSETLTADGRQSFAGATRLCEVVRDVVVANPDMEESTYDRGRLWYARLLSDGRMFPVRMEYDTPFGQVSGYLGELDSAGVHLNFDGK
jgi:hypothetical protein